MKDLSAPAFGYLIAFVLPGLVSLLAVTTISPGASEWLSGVASCDPSGISVGGFLSTSLAALGAGLLTSAGRWLCIDRIHHSSGLVAPDWDDARLFDRVEAFESLVLAHYRFYQHYANCVVAATLLLIARLASAWERHAAPAPLDWCIALFIVLYWTASKDSMRKYYARTARLLTIKENHRDQWPQEGVAQHPRPPGSSGRSPRGCGRLRSHRPRARRRRRRRRRDRWRCL